MARSRSRQRGSTRSARPSPRHRRPAVVSIGLPDRRSWSPYTFDAAAATRRAAVHLVTQPLATPIGIYRKVSQPRREAQRWVTFADPRKVLVCRRRKLRRRIMFALGHRRKGSGAARRKRHEWSDVRC